MLIHIVNFGFCQNEKHIKDSILLSTFRSERNFFKDSIIGKEYVKFNFKINEAFEISDSILIGKITFINLWFQSCHPCIAEMDGLNRMYDSLKNNKNFQFISFSRDDENTILKNIIKYNIKYKVYHLDNSQCYELNYHSGFPYSIIIDRKKKVKLVSGGGSVDKKEATEKVMKVYYPKILQEL